MLGSSLLHGVFIQSLIINSVSIIHPPVITHLASNMMTVHLHIGDHVVICTGHYVVYIYMIFFTIKGIVSRLNNWDSRMIVFYLSVIDKPETNK